MDARELAGRLCGDLVQGVYEDEGTTFIATTLPYPTGDLITLFVDRDDLGDFVHDGGMTRYWLAVEGVDETGPRKEFILASCVLHDVEDDGRLFRKRLSDDVPGADALALCQAVIRVSTLRYDRTSRSTKRLSEQVETLVETRISPNRLAVQDWTDPTLDENRSHLVDYHFNGQAKDGQTRIASDIYVAASRERIEAVAGIIQFWHRMRRPFKSMCIIPEDVSASGSSLDRLRSAADVIFSGVAKHEASITTFALSTEARVPLLMAERGNLIGLIDPGVDAEEV